MFDFDGILLIYGDKRKRARIFWRKVNYKRVVTYLDKEWNVPLTRIPSEKID